MVKGILKVGVCTVFLSILFFVLSCTSFAQPIEGEVYHFNQPDGSKVEVRVYGDEFYQRVESHDGYSLVRNDVGYICYAYLDNNGQFTATNEIYRGEPLYSEKAFQLGIEKGLCEQKSIILKKIESVKKEISAEVPVSTPAPQLAGEYNLEIPPFETASPQSYEGLVILIDFPDKKSDVPKEQIIAAINQPGTGSVYDYFYDISGGKVKFTNRVVGFYTAKYNKSHYDSGTGYAGSTELLYETLNWLKGTGFDSSGLTKDSNNRIKAVSLIYAGAPEAGWANGLWPHSGGLRNFDLNGAYVSAHQFSNIGTRPQPNAMTHECEHMILGWPDYYDYDGDSKVIGRFNEGVPNPYSRCVLSRWYEIKWLNNLPDGSIVTVPANTMEVFGYINPQNSNEMFIIENIRKTGKWYRFPGEGLVVWHIDKRGNNNWQDMTAMRHYITSVEQADGRFDMEKNVNTGDTGDFFYAGYRDAFTDTTIPNSKWWNGQPSGFNITEIGSIGNTITFKLNNNGSVVPSRSTAFSRIEAESYTEGKEVQTSTCSEGGSYLGWIENGDYIVYKNIDFGSGASAINLRVASATAGGNMEFRLDSLDGKIIGSCNVSSTGSWTTWTTLKADIQGADGVHDLYIRFSGGTGSLFDINWMEFIPATNFTAEKLYKITAMHSGKCMEIANGATANGASVVQNEYADKNNQIWLLKDAGDGYYQIVSKLSAKALAISGSSLEDGADVIQWDYLDNDNQKFRFESTGEDYYKIIAKHSDKCVDVYGISMSNNANVHQWAYLNGDNQKWNISEVVPAVTPTPTITPTPSLTPTHTSTATPTPTPSNTPTTTPTDTSIIYGDVNGNGRIDSVDFAYMRMKLLGMIEDFPHSSGVLAADVNRDREFNAIDFALMRMYLLGIIDDFTAQN